ncbi:hypothetical protein ACRALDRAFT_1071774 [Sodiomyces alcalophilus JCM 7366]|uniref:uncharacterized protein n=1 Tax=Sodiomyces alcalophilus JCM 7366 TaxID=591952 RepID=UPI0039B5BDA4
MLKSYSTGWPEIYTLYNPRADSPLILRDLKGVYPLTVIANAYLDIAEKVLTPEYRLLLSIADIVKGKELAPFTTSYDSLLVELKIKVKGSESLLIRPAISIVECTIYETSYKSETS